MTNIVRHARPDQFWLLLQERDDALRLEIRDDGAGFDVASALERAARGASFSLLGMRERVELLGGTMEIQSQPGRGSTIGVRFPIHSAPDNSIGESR